jgi:hypothetical protein
MALGSKSLTDSELMALTSLYMAEVATFNADVAKFGHAATNLISPVRARLTEELVRRGVLLPDEVAFDRPPKSMPSTVGPARLQGEEP